MGKYSFLCAWSFNVSTIFSGTGKGDCPKPKLYTFLPWLINSLHKMQAIHDFARDRNCRFTESSPLHAQMAFLRDGLAASRGRLTRCFSTAWYAWYCHLKSCDRKRYVTSPFALNLDPRCKSRPCRFILAHYVLTCWRRTPGTAVSDYR